MVEKTLGRVAQEAFWNATGPTSADDWDVAVDAAIQAHEERRWRAIDTAPKDGTQVLLYMPPFDEWPNYIGISHWHKPPTGGGVCVIRE